MIIYGVNHVIIGDDLDNLSNDPFNAHRSHILEEYLRHMTQGSKIKLVIFSEISVEFKDKMVGFRKNQICCLDLCMSMPS